MLLPDETSGVLSIGKEEYTRTKMQDMALGLQEAAPTEPDDKKEAALQDRTSGSHTSGSHTSGSHTATTTQAASSPVGATTALSAAPPFRDCSEDHLDMDGSNSRNSGNTSGNPSARPLNSAHDDEADSDAPTCFSLPGECDVCGGAGEHRTTTVQIPHFGSAMVLCFSCSQCGGTHSEVKRAEAIPDHAGLKGDFFFQWKGFSGVFFYQWEFWRSLGVALQCASRCSVPTWRI